MARKRDKVHYIIANKAVCGTLSYRLHTQTYEDITCGNCKKVAPKDFEYASYKGWKITDAPGWLFQAYKNVSMREQDNTITAATINQLKVMITQKEKQIAPRVKKHVDLDIDTTIRCLRSLISHEISRYWHSDGW